MADYKLANVPSVSIARTKFNRPFSHNLSFNLGELCVLGCDEVIPGSTHKLNYGALIRMSTPIAPLMDDLVYDVFSFFCPARLCWENWKRFMGENTTSTGAINGVNSDKSIPMFTTKGSKINSLADDFGIPAYVSGNSAFEVSALPFRAYYLIYNRWFRNQNVEKPYLVGLTDAVSGDDVFNNAGLYSSNDTLPVGGIGASRKIAFKLPDYFTSALPFAQKGDPVQIPLSGLAPVYSLNTPHTVPTPAYLHMVSGDTGAAITSAYSLGTDATGYVVKTGSTGTNNGGVTPDNLYADLSNAINSTINDLRFAFQMQKFLEKDALYGSRYWEILYAHYAVTSPDASLQDPQLLGHKRFDIAVQQVLQTTGFTDPSNTNLGTPGANSTTASKGEIFTASFVEHGYLITIGVARQKSHTYSQGLNRMWSRSVRTDFYFPVFANLGAQKVLKKEIDVQAINPNEPFGYQEAWAEYRFLCSYNSGMLNPVRSGSLDYWTLAENFGSTPTLGPTFLKEDRTPLTRCLVTGANGPDFIASFYFKDTCVNPMPLYSIPGFADHH